MKKIQRVLVLSYKNYLAYLFLLKEISSCKRQGKLGTKCCKSTIYIASACELALNKFHTLLNNEVSPKEISQLGNDESDPKSRAKLKKLVEFFSCIVSR